MRPVTPCGKDPGLACQMQIGGVDAVHAKASFMDLRKNIPENLDFFIINDKRSAPIMLPGIPCGEAAHAKRHKGLAIVCEMTSPLQCKSAMCADFYCLLLHGGVVVYRQGAIADKVSYKAKKRFRCRRSCRRQWRPCMRAGGLELLQQLWLKSEHVDLHAVVQAFDVQSVEALFYRP